MMTMLILLMTLLNGPPHMALVEVAARVWLMAGWALGGAVG